jgi:hypothetical protein
MIALHDRVSIESALRSNLDCQLRQLMNDCLSQTIRATRYDLADFTSLVIVEPGDTDDDICCEIGFSPLSNLANDVRLQRGVLKAHSGWFELVFLIGNDGFAYVLFVKDAEGVEPDLLALCRSPRAKCPIL